MQNTCFLFRISGFCFSLPTFLALKTVVMGKLTVNMELSSLATVLPPRT
jgi:hypothetical protein